MLNKERIKLKTLRKKTVGYASFIALNWIVSMTLFASGCSLEKDYAKLSNKQACGNSDCGKEP